MPALTLTVLLASDGLSDLLSVGTILGIAGLAGVALALVKKHWYRTAQLLFAVATLLTDAKVIRWALTSDIGLKSRVGFGILGVLAFTFAGGWAIWRTQCDQKEATASKRDYLISQLREFIKEGREIETLPMLRQMGERFAYRSTVEHFLGLYSVEWVVRFKAKNRFALQEIIAELLDGKPIPVSGGRPVEPIKAPIQSSIADHSEQDSLDRVQPTPIHETVSRSPRELSEEQLQFLAHCITAVRGSITVQMFRGDSEAVALGRRLAQVLRNSGWQVDWRTMSSPPPEVGIVIKSRAIEGLSPANSALVSALNEIDLSPTLARDLNLTETILVIGANTKIDT